MNEFDKLRGEKSTLSIKPIQQPASTTSSTYTVEEGEPTQSFQKPRENAFDILEQDRTALDESLYEHSRYIASQRDSARMGEAMKAAPEFGMDPSFVYENLDTIKKEKAPFAPFSMLNKDYPNTVNLLKDPNFATLLKNEVENLKKVEEATKEYGFAASFSKSLTGGLAGFGSRLAGSIPMLYDSYRMARNKSLEKITGKKVEELPSWVVGINKKGDEIWDENSALSQIEFKLREKQKEIQKPIEFELGGSFLDLMADGDYGKAAKTLVMQAANNAPNSLVAIGSVLTGAPAVGLLGIGATAAAGKDEDLKESQPGLSEETRLLNATLTGGVEATTEMIGALLPFAQAMKPVNQIIGKQFGKEAAKAVSREFFKTILVATGSGFAEEAAATIGEATVDYSTNVNKDAFNNILKDTLNSGISGAFSGGAMTGPSALAGASFRSRTLMQAQAGYNFWMSLGDATARNEALKDMPEAKARAIQELTKNGNVENAFIDMKGFVELFQKKGIDPAKAAQQLGISKEFSEASEAGTDITVKTADVASKLVGTEEYGQIAEHVKFDADGTTIAQEREDQARAQETMAGVEQELKEIESESVDDPAKMINSVFVQEGKEIARIVKEQVKQAGRSAQEASKSGQLYEAFFRTLAKKDESGRTPLQLFNQYNLRIRRMNAPTAVSGEALNQPAKIKTDTPEFKAWFGDSKAVDAEGNPQVLYHGTKADIEAFDPTKLGSSTEVSSAEEAFFFSDNPKIAELFGYIAPTKARQEHERLSKEYNEKFQAGKKESSREMKALLKRVNAAYDEAKKNGYAGKLTDSETKIYPVYTSLKNPMYVDMKGKEFQSGQVGELVREAKSKGHDGVIFDNAIDTPHRKERTPSRIVSVFSPTQIKSVNNRGTFDPNDPRILYQNGPRVYDIPAGYDRPSHVDILRVDSNVGNEAQHASMDAAKKFAKAIFKKTPVLKNDHSKISARIGKIGIQEIAGGVDSLPHRVALTHIDELFKDAIYNGPEALNRPKDGVKQYYIFHAPMRIGTEDFVVKIRVEDLLNADPRLYHQVVLEVEKKKPTGISELSSGFNGVSGSAGSRLVINIDDFIDLINAVQSNAPYGGSGGSDGGAAGGTMGFFPQSPQTLSQNQGDPMGRIVFGKDGVNIDLFKKSDPSTMIHESGHFFLKVMKDMIADGSANEQLQADYKAIWKWLGAEEGSELTVEQEEKWARGIEAYVMEGKAPSTALQKAFKFFENWLKVLYQKVEALGVDINPEIRGVMDRIFATQEEIEIAESNYTDLMAESSDQLSPAMREKYAKLKVQARDEAENKLKSKLMESHMQKSTEAYKKQQADVRDIYLAEINESEFQQAIGKMLTPEGVKINPTSLSEELKSRMPADVLSADGMPVEVIASSMGYNTSTEFVDAFEAAYTERTTELDTRVEQEMQRRFPDSIFEISDQALEAVHNEYKSKIHALEFEFLQENAKGLTKDLTKQVIRRGKTTEFLKSRAEALIDEKNFKELKPYLYERAERKAAKEAADAFAKKDIDGALKAKEREVLAHEMFKKAIEAERFYKDKIKDTKKFAKSDKDLSATRDTDFINAARAILARYGLNRRQEAAQDYLKKLSEYAPEVYNGLNSIMESVYVGAKDYKEVSYKQFKEMMTVVDALWELSRSSRQITIDGKKLDLNEVKQELMDQLGLLPDTRKAEYTKTASDFDKFKTKFLGAKASMKRMEAWVDAIDLKYGGPFRKYIWEPVSKAVTTYRLEKQKVLQTYKNLLEGHVAKFEAKEIVAGELGHTFRNKAELLMAVLHSGNESNLSKLLRGRQWGEKGADGVLDTSRWDTFISRMQSEGVLTKEDYDFAQSIWDLMESFKPMTQQAHKAMYGYFFSEITAQKISTPWGDYKGGYVPAKVDIYTNEDAELRNERQEFEQNNAAWSFPTTGKGATMSRVEAYAAPLSLDMNLLGAHLDWALRFAYIEPTVKEVARLVYAKDFRESLRAVDPEIAKFGLVPWLKRTATQQVVTPSQSGILKFTDWAASKVRSNMAMQIMMGNLSNALQQITGFSVAMSVVKPHQFAKGLVQYMQNPKALVEEISSKSKWFASTQDSNLYETIGAVQTILTNPNTFQKAVDFSKKHTYFLQTFTQNMVNTITWQAAYNQASETMNEAEAVQFADSAVRRTQGSVSPEDISDFETGTPTARMFTQFVGYFNMLYNLMSTEYFKAYKSMGLKQGSQRMFYVTFFAFTMPAVMSELIVRAMAGKPLDEDDDEEYLDDIMKVYFGSQAKTALAMVPYIGQFGAAGYNQLFTKEQWDDRVSLSPAIGAAETTVSAGVNLYKLLATEDKVSTKKATKDALTTIGVLTGLPAGVLGKPAGYLIDLEEGKIEEPESTVDFTRGLITGKGKRTN